MSAPAWFQLALIVGPLAVTIGPLGRYMAAVHGAREDGSAPGDRVFGPVERAVYRLCRIDADREQRWTAYALSLLAFSATSVLGLYLLLRVQGGLPLDPNGVDGVSPTIAFDTAASFVTNTNWQSYGGESTMSHLSQRAGLAVQNFVSAAVGMAVAVALVRGLVRSRSATIGNFWVDLTRTVVRILLPLSLVASLFFVSQGGHPEPRWLPGRDHGRGGRPVDPRRPRRQPGRHQAARHQRWRLDHRITQQALRRGDREGPDAGDLAHLVPLDMGSPQGFDVDAQQRQMLRSGRPPAAGVVLPIPRPAGRSCWPSWPSRSASPSWRDRPGPHRRSPTPDQPTPLPGPSHHATAGSRPGPSPWPSPSSRPRETCLSERPGLPRPSGDRSAATPVTPRTQASPSRQRASPAGRVTTARHSLGEIPGRSLTPPHPHGTVDAPQPSSGPGGVTSTPGPGQHNP